MDQYIEFAGRHPLLMLGLLVVVGLIIYTESDRLLSGIKSLSPAQATRLQNDDQAQFIDVRSGKEFAQGHILQARNIPTADVPKKLNELEKFRDKTLVFYCNAGLSARSPARKLRKAGFANVAILTGGIEAWGKAGLPLVTR